MATIQSKITNGHKYWYIVESRRVNGKPRPIVLEYLGKADDLLRRLQGLNQNFKLKSYSHGLVSALLSIADKLDICNIINKNIFNNRKYIADKPIRNHLTAGATIMLAALGRACSVVSKDGFSDWVRTTSLEYLLRTNFSKVNSQHFWDMMDSLPVEKISKIESEILKKVLLLYDVGKNTLCYDTTNYYTYIDTTNQDCTIAKRGKNKQKRNDLRQVGLVLVVTQKDMIPLFHDSYEGNMNDAKVFGTIIEKIKTRFIELDIDVSKQTIVFDRGSNSKKNLELIKSLGMNYVGALSPNHHKALMDEASKSFQPLKYEGTDIMSYRTRVDIWGQDVTVLVIVSDSLKDGQMRELYGNIEKCLEDIANLNALLKAGKLKKTTEEKLKEKVGKILDNLKTKDYITYEIVKSGNSSIEILYNRNEDNIKRAEQDMGYRIIMTSRHDWESVAIIKSYFDQYSIEHAFKNMKNQKHLSFNPQFHWTDQKIRVHNFCCVLGYLMTSLIYKKLKEDCNFSGNIDSMQNTLANIRLGTVIEDTGKKGAQKVIYKLESMDKAEEKIMQSLGLIDFHTKPQKIKGLSVYN